MAFGKTRSRGRRKHGTNNGRMFDRSGLLRLCNGCGTDHAREWHKAMVEGWAIWTCDQCWPRRFV